MRREPLLVGGAIAVVALALLAIALLPGAVVHPAADESDDEPPGRVAIEEVTIAPGEVTGETATLVVDTRLAHHGGTTENVTVAVRAVDHDSEMVETTVETEVSELSGDHERSVPANVTVPREGDYHIETIVYEDDARTADATATVRTVDALSPPHAETTVEFHRFAGGSDDAPPVIQYAVDSVQDADATLSVSTYLTNTGDEPESELELVVQARQAESNVVADEERIDVGTIDPGRTDTPTVSLTVPDGYNYYLDATLWRDGVIVGDTRSAANLAPGEPMTVNTTDYERTLEVTDFTDDDPQTTPAPEPVYDEDVDEDESAPGFGVLMAIVALLGAAALARRSA